MQSERERAAQDYKVLMDHLWRSDDNPPYGLARPTIENIVGSHGLFNLEDYGFIKAAGRNMNGIDVYIVR